MAAPDYFLARRGQGPGWDFELGRRDQRGWEEHAAFMDALVADGFVVLGGPKGADVDRGDVLPVVAAEDEAAVRARLAEDPWEGDLLFTRSVEPWRVWLRASAGR
jgi:uncharacterized protein YciI